MPLLQEPITKEQFERELLTLPPKEADSRREFWILCEALQAMEDTNCSPPDWFIESFNDVLEHPSEERASPGGNYGIACSSIWANSSESRGQLGSDKNGSGISRIKRWIHFRVR